MKIAIITQARLSSSRLPEKVLKKIQDKTLLEIHLSRLKKVPNINKIIVATTFEPGVEKILAVAKNAGVDYYQGSTEDVLARFYGACSNLDVDVVVRVTSDCPLVDPTLMNHMLAAFKNKGVDYCSNVLNPTFPDGFDTEIMTKKALESAFINAKQKYEREHVTPYIWENTDVKGKNIFKAYSFENKIDYSKLRMTVDNEDDFKRIKILIEALGTEKPWEKYVQYYIENPTLFSDLKNDERNAGFKRE